MNSELKSTLLSAKNRTEFANILIEQFPNWRNHRELWDDELIKHCLKIYNFSKEQFENAFKKNFIPIDELKKVNKENRK